MEKIIVLLKNVKGSPKTTIAGLICMIVGGYLIYEMGVKELEYSSIEAGLFITGLWLFILKVEDKDEGAK